MAYIGDFPQQQENSGFRRPTAHQGCRHCDIPHAERGNLSFDLTSGGARGRFHHEVVRQRQHMASLPSKNQQEKFATKRGMVVEAPMLSIITPALDLLRTRPADTAHSEYGGLTKMLHMLLVDQVLTPTGMTQYAKTLRIFPSPPGWKRLQSAHHV